MTVGGFRGNDGWVDLVLISGCVYFYNAGGTSIYTGFYEASEMEGYTGPDGSHVWERNLGGEVKWRYDRGDYL